MPRAKKQTPDERRQKQAERMRKVREDTARREAEQAADSEARRVARENEGRRASERIADAEARRLAREDAARREAEQAANSEARRVAREDESRRASERVADAEARRLAREDAARRETEQAANSEARRVAREDPSRQQSEQLYDSARKRKQRADADNREAEQQQNTIAKRAKKAHQESSYEHLLEEFQILIRLSPSIICSCCGCLWYKASTTPTTRDKLIKAGISEDSIAEVLCVDQQNHRFCSTCKKHIFGKQGFKIPKLALSNGFRFPVVPEEIRGLSPVEERLVAPRLPFTQIFTRGPEQQSFIRGNVVNVENDVLLCTKSIPRPFGETGTVILQLMRRMVYQKPYMEERIRTAKVYRAAKYLISTPLYQQEGVLINEDWKDRPDDDLEDFVVDEVVTDQNADIRPTNSCTAADDSSDDDTDEEDTGCIDLPSTEGVVESTEIPCQGCEESVSYVEKEMPFKGIRIAPAEGNTPIPFYRDPYAEELAFPTLYGGQMRQFKCKVSTTDIYKSEIRGFDRRACSSTPLLYKAMKSLGEKVNQAVQMAIRQQSPSSRITAGNARSEEYLQRLIDKDDGYTIFRNIRTSPCYWKQQQKKVLGMIRQLGTPAFFITFSAAETRWPELLASLHKILRNEDISEEDASKLPFADKAELIRKDPVTCMLNYDHRFRALLNKLLKPVGGVFSPFELSDYFTRVEFQMRGSPHTHGMYWIKNAPSYKEGCETSMQECVQFIDQFITCQRDEEGEMAEVLSYQLHAHSHTCYKKNRTKKLCRFGFPKPPMPETIILTPMDKKIEDQEYIVLCQKRFKAVQETLSDWGRSFKEDLDFGDFLLLLGLSHDEYIAAVRSSIRRTTVFLKRKTSEAFINSYNRKLLQAWKANIDIQFILDSYACAKYCVGYIMKAESGVSKLLHAAAEEVKAGNFSVREKLRKFANTLIHGTEMSTQEAAAFLLGLSNTLSSRQDVFINTSEPQKRIGMLLPLEALNKLEEDSEDIFVKGLLDHYKNRPLEQDNICLAEFASMFEFVKAKKKVNKGKTGSEHENEFSSSEREDNEDGFDEPPVAEPPVPPVAVAVEEPEHSLMLLDNSGFMRKRKVRKIIRYRNYNKETDKTNFCRERLTLFKPWRNEEDDLLVINAAAEYEKSSDEIKLNSAPFFFYSEEEQTRLSSILNELEEEHEADIDVLRFSNDQDLFNDEDAMTGGFQNSRTKPRVESFRPPKLVPEVEYLILMRSLNDKQRKFVFNVMHLIKTSDQPFYFFLSGGAGVGKSHVIHAIVQSVLRHSFESPSVCPNQSPVIVCAPTGKAAYNVGGVTIHCGLKLPPNQSAQQKLAPLENGIINSLRTRVFANADLFIIDEISMTSEKQLFQISARMKQIFGTEEDFGGKSVIVVGHLRQLPPVMGRMVFLPPKSTAGEILGNVLCEKFKLFELDEIMKQKGDLEFCTALNNMAEGTMTDQDVMLIRSREISENNPAPQNAIHLFHSNQQCVEFNEKFHASLDTEGAVATAHDIVTGENVSEARARYYLERAKSFSTSDADGLPYQTRLQVGGTYFVSSNVDVSDGLFNGSTGTLEKIDFGLNPNGERIPAKAWLQFHHHLVGSISRQKTKCYQERNQIDLNWTAIARLEKSLNLGPEFRGIELIRKQLPLVPANGMTIAKSQGSSLPSVVVCVKPIKCKNSNRDIKLSRELLYVACCRATSLKGLGIDGKFEKPKPPKPNDPVTLEMERLRSIPFVFNLVFLQDYTQHDNTLFFMNVQFIMKHYKDLTSDLCPMSASFIGLVEPHILEQDNLHFDGFDLVHRTNSSSRQSSDGALVFAKSHLQSIFINHISKRDDSGHCLLTSWMHKNTYFVMAYKSPKCKRPTFLSLLQDVLVNMVGDIVFFGDINIDLSRVTSESFVQFMSTFQLESKLDISNSSRKDGTH